MNLIALYNGRRYISYAGWKFINRSFVRNRINLVRVLFHVSSHRVASLKSHLSAATIRTCSETRLPYNRFKSRFSHRLGMSFEKRFYDNWNLLSRFPVKFLSAKFRGRRGTKEQRQIMNVVLTVYSQNCDFFGFQKCFPTFSDVFLFPVSRRSTGVRPHLLCNQLFQNISLILERVQKIWAWSHSVFFIVGQGFRNKSCVKYAFVEIFV